MSMNTLVIILIAAVFLLGGYMLYGRWLAKKWGIDPQAKTPAVVHNDGRRLRSHQWLDRIRPSVFLDRRSRPCYRCDPGCCFRMGSGSSVDPFRRSLLRSRYRFRSTVRQCEK